MTCCQAVVRETLALVLPTAVEPVYSRTLSFTTAPGASDRTHTLAVYVVPARVVVTQFGESLRPSVVDDVPVFVSSAFHPPLWPPAARASVVPVRTVFHPAVLVSNPGLPIRLPS